MFKQREIELASIYRHFKTGALYYTMHFAGHTENGEELIVYHALYGEKETHSKPTDLFLEEVEEGRDNPLNQKYKYELVNVIEPMKVAIIINGGHVQTILTNNVASVCVIDYDVDGDYKDAIKVFGYAAHASEREPEIDENEIDLLLADIRKEEPYFEAN